MGKPCRRCPRSGRSPRLPGDFLCQRCRAFQGEVSAAAFDPCDQLLVAILGDPEATESSRDFPRARPASPRKLSGIRLAISGKGGTAEVRRLVDRLLPGEKAIVASALGEGPAVKDIQGI